MKTLLQALWAALTSVVLETGKAPARKMRPVRLAVKTQPKLECLEDRIAPAAWVVNATTDTGAGAANTGDLRYCTTNAASGDTIYMASSMSGQTIKLSKQIILTNSLTILAETTTGAQVNGVTISGLGNTRIFDISSGIDTITGFTFTGGNGTNGAGTAGNGGAILQDSAAGTLTLITDSFNNNTTGNGTNGGAIENDGNMFVSGCSFNTNIASGSGGAIQSTGNLTVNASQGGTASTFTNNVANAGNGVGGAISASNEDATGSLFVAQSQFLSNSANKGGAIYTNYTTSLQNDTFGLFGQKNSSTASGGAVYADALNPNPNPNVSLQVGSCSFSYNQAGNDANGGGAIATYVPTSVESSIFTQNTALSGGAAGGAIDANSSGLNLIQDTFTSNSAKSGGAVYISGSLDNNAGSVSFSVNSSTFSGNQAISGGAGLGGALYIYENAGTGSSVDTKLINDTFFQNNADLHGGAIVLSLNTGGGVGSVSAELTSLTVYKNTAGADSGGLYVDGSMEDLVTVNNAIFSGNTVTNPRYNGPVDVTQTADNVIDDQGYNLVGTTDTMFANIALDVAKTDTPGLAAALAQNGAPAAYPQTLALQNTSAGYQKGDNSLAGTSDERGFLRQSGKVSIGAEDPDAKIVTDVSLNSSADPVLLGQTVTFTAVVTSTGGTPTGTVTFSDGSTQLGTATLDSSGSATFSTNSLPQGGDNISAVYNGDSNFNGSSGSMTEVVSEETGSSITLSSSANPATPNQTITLTAVVSGSNGTPTGSVTFMDGNTTLGTTTLNASGDATLSTSALALGSHAITAVYSGDGTYGDRSTSMVQAVMQASSTTYVSSSNSNSPPNQAVTFTATVNGMGQGTPTGTVTFLDGATVLGTGELAVVNGQDVATLSISTLAVGAHDIIAVYGGDGTFSDSDASLMQNVSPTATGTSLTSSVNPSQPGQAVTFTATVSAMGSGTPTGTVTFLDGTTVLGTGTLGVVNGRDQATYGTNALSGGFHTITAIYGGDGTYAGSDGSTPQMVGQPSGNGSTTYVTSSSGSSQPGQSVTFTATVMGSGATPSGMVTFQDGTTVLGTGTLSVVNNQDQATFSTSTLAIGPHNIIAVYGGDSTHGSSVSSLTQTVHQAGTTLSLSTSDSSALPGQVLTLTATITSSGTPTGSVTFYDGTTLLGTASVTVVNGQVQATLAAFFDDVGAHAITAVYAGDGTYAASSASLTEQVNQGGTTTTLTSSSNPSPQGQPVTFTATVAATGMGGGTPTGAVSFYDGTTFLGTGTLTLVNGQMEATFTTSVLGLGTHQIIAIYSGDSSFADSSSSFQQAISS